MANKHAFLEKLRAIVLEHYSEEQFGVSDLVEQFGMSRSQLHRKLKSATGQSVSQFIREIRLDEALKLLQKEDITASEVAYKVGFNSPTYFNACFNEYFGYPPGESQLQMELARSNSNSEEPSPAKVPKVRKNRRAVLWFFIITAAVLALFVYKYVNREEATLISTSEEKEKTIAVLPLKNWSGDVELEYVSDGITDAIISKLSGIQSIDRVVSFTSILQYKDTNNDISTIAEELGVQYVLEGNFKLSGDQVQINLNLIEVETNKHLWPMEYSGAWSDDIFKMQAAVAENVAQYIRADATREEIEQIHRVPTENSEAYMLYLEGFYQAQVLANSEMENSIPIFEKAIALDSTFIEPHLALGDNYLKAGVFWGIYNEQEAWSKAKPYFQKALELDSLIGGRQNRSIMSSLIRGKFYFEWDLESMERFYYDEKARLINLFVGISCEDYSTKMGRFQDAMLIIDQIILDDPTRSVPFMFKGVIYYFMGEDEKALAIFETYNKASSHNYWYLIETAKYYYFMDKIELSKRQLQLLLDNFDARPPIILWLIAIHAQLEGNTNVQNESLEKLRSKFKDNTSGSPAWFIALYYCHNKDYDNAFEWLERSYDRHEVEMMWLKEEPMLRPLRTDPRYIDLYDKVGFSKISPITPYVQKK